MSAQWLPANPGTQVFAVAPETAFERYHIPGARDLPPAAAADPRSLSAALAAARVEPGAPILLYQDAGWPIAVARAWAMFDALGLGNLTHALSGGLRAWRAAGGALASGPGPLPAASRPLEEARPCPGALVSRAFIRLHLGQPGLLLLDARLPAFFNGNITEPGELPGHIPTAVNLPFSQLAGPDGTFTPAAQAALHFEAVGVAAQTSVVAYCHSGNKAGIVYLAARILGHPAQLYTGSWHDWSAPASNTRRRSNRFRASKTAGRGSAAGAPAANRSATWRRPPTRGSPRR